MDVVDDYYSVLQKTRCRCQ